MPEIFEKESDVLSRNNPVLRALTSKDVEIGEYKEFMIEDDFFKMRYKYIHVKNIHDKSRCGLGRIRFSEKSGLKNIRF